MRALPLLLGAATAFLVACGGGDGRIPSSDASSIERALDRVSADFDAGRCAAAEQAVTELNGELVNLPNSVDSSLRNRLRSGVAHLDDRVRATCGQSGQQQTQTQTQTQQQTQTNEQTDTETDTQTNTDTNTDTGTTGTGTTDTGTTGTGTTGTGTTGTGTGTGTGGTGGTPPSGGDGG